ncbi:MAG: SigF/SigG family RNA polymerase sporulation sigma factor [Lachnospiraceae bacterium]|nr:SigF/SigG family RNA polymerase sporulation sigma factor [Lachnospiraceae bacterium]
MEEVSVRIAKAQAGDRVTREVLIEENLGLVHHIVRRFLGRGYDAEDLFQIGTIGLMKAIDKFDLNFDVKFSTYAVPMISGEIKRFLRDDGMVKVGRALKENGFKVKAASERLMQQLGREPSLEEVAVQTGLSVEDVVMAMEASAEVESIYKSVYQADGSEIFLIDKLATEDKEKESLMNEMLVKQLLEELGEQERELIMLRFFGEHTQMEVAKKLGISQVQVSRLEKKILIGMRQKVT